MSPQSLEVGPGSRLDVLDETTLRNVYDPIPAVARLTDSTQWTGYFCDMVDYARIYALIGLGLQPLLTHVREPSTTGRHVVLPPLGSG